MANRTGDPGGTDGETTPAERQAEARIEPAGQVRQGRLGGIGSMVLPALAFAGLAVFLGILAVWVPRIDLLTVIAFTLLLAGWDFFVRR